MIIDATWNVNAIMKFRYECDVPHPLSLDGITRAVSIPIDFKWEHRRILQIKVDADFVSSAMFIFTRAKHVFIVQGQRMWNVAFVTISPTHTKLHNSMH